MNFVVTGKNWFRKVAFLLKKSVDASKNFGPREIEIYPFWGVNLLSVSTVYSIIQAPFHPQQSMRMYCMQICGCFLYLRCNAKTDDAIAKNFSRWRIQPANRNRWVSFT